MYFSKSVSAFHLLFSSLNSIESCILYEQLRAYSRIWKDVYTDLGASLFFFNVCSFLLTRFPPSISSCFSSPKHLLSIWQDYIFDLRSFCCTSAVLTVVPHGESCVNVDLISFFVFFFFQWLNPLLFLPAFGH